MDDISNMKPAVAKKIMQEIFRKEKVPPGDHNDRDTHVHNENIAESLQGVEFIIFCYSKGRVFPFKYSNCIIPCLFGYIPEVAFQPEQVLFPIWC